MNGFLKNKEAT